MTARDHECSACGGTGREYSYTPSGIESGRLSSAEYTSIQRCPVCLGSGRISDVRTARDAMVDAETLRQNGLTTDIDRGLPYAQVILGFNVLPSDAAYAARAAFRAVPALRGEGE